MLVFLVCFVGIASGPLTAVEPVVNRGVVRIGPPLTHKYEMQNRSSAMISITDMTSTCGCLRPAIDRREVQPGQSTTITVEVNTLSQPAGPVSWATTVNYRHGDVTGSLRLELRANLIEEVRVEPASVAFHIRQPRSVTLTVTDTRTKPFAITGVGTSMSQISAELVPIEPGMPRQIRLTARPDGPAGTHTAIAWFTTDDPLYPLIRVPVSLTIAGKTRISAMPPAVLLDGGSAVVQLRDRDGEAVVVERIETDGPVQAKSASGPGNHATIRFSLIREQWDGQPATVSAKVFIKAPTQDIIKLDIGIR